MGEQVPPASPAVLSFGSPASATKDGSAVLPVPPLTSAGASPLHPSASSSSQPSIVDIIGAAGLAAVPLPHSSGGTSSDKSPEKVSLGQDVTNSVFAQVLQVITTLQGRLQENEVAIDELESNRDSVDGKCRSWRRQVDRAETDLVAAESRRDTAQLDVKRVRAEVTPLIERFMEAEVLHSQLDADAEEIERLRSDMEACDGELLVGMPRLRETECMESELSQAIAELETAHMDEVTTLRALHMEEMSDLRVQFSANFADIESLRLVEASNAQVKMTEDLGRLRAAMQEAEWQADVYTREQEDMIREVCIKQRDNTRVAKRYGEARQEAMELTAEWEASEPHAQESELHIVRQRCALLQRTATEWRDALHRKRSDCARWRDRAAKRGIDVGQEETDDEEVFVGMDSGFDDAPSVPSAYSQQKSPQRSPSEFIGRSRITTQGTVMEISSISLSVPGSPSRSALRLDPPWSELATPTWTPQPMRSQMSRTHSAPSGLPQLPQGRAQAPGMSSLSAFPWDFIESLAVQDNRDDSSTLRSTYSSAPQTGLLIPEPASQLAAPEQKSKPKRAQSTDGDAAHEFFAAALHAAQVWAEAETAGKLSTSQSPDTAAGETAQVSSPDAELRRKLSSEVIEAENELEMLAFLLEEADTTLAAKLLERQARHQPPQVAVRLRHHRESLLKRRRS